MYTQYIIILYIDTWYVMYMILFHDLRYIYGTGMYIYIYIYKYIYIYICFVLTNVVEGGGALRKGMALYLKF